MKLHFEDNLDYQKIAISSVVDLFKGQEVNRNEFTLNSSSNKVSLTDLDLSESELGVGNKLLIEKDQFLQNLQDIQLRNGLHLSKPPISNNFTVEMETGTGKTYVYLRTIFELNKHYEFSKFVIVVPSIAIKEGTYKTLEITREHFENLYPMAKGYEYFQYDSLKPANVRNFATSSNIQIMVVTVGAINKRDVNNLYKESEKLGGNKPIDLVSATNPIIIVDEPQIVEGGLKGRGKEALNAMNPLCTLRYSATHLHKYQMVYRLDAVDAYERELVKQIEVAALEVEGGHNKPFVKLVATENKRGYIMAKIEVDVIGGGKVKRNIISVDDGEDLEQRTNRSIYENFRIGTITSGKHNQTVELFTPSGAVVLQPGQEVGGVNTNDLRRLMIRRTIKEHFEKEKRFTMQGLDVKVLSLFFIDKVEHYRQYDESGNVVKGKYAKVFEEEYLKLAKSPEYNILFDDVNPNTNATDVHDGYFSIDKRGGWIETTNEDNQINRSNAERAYNLIMKDKEKLLSFQSKLKFIFSHSALKEGWDNPNIFQICTLREFGSEHERRQTIGRGLRLCVNQSGQRLRGFDVNTLTVIATESYEKFAENLQKEIEEDTGIRFGFIETHQFANLTVITKDGKKQPLGVEKSKKIFDYLCENNLIDKMGYVQDLLRTALKDGTLNLPEEFAEQNTEIKYILKKLAGNLDIKSADERITIRTNEGNLESEEFKALWDRIKHKTTYRVNFNNDKLIQDCARAIEKGPIITKTRARFQKIGIGLDRGGMKTKLGKTSKYTTINESDIEQPDILTSLQNETQLTRKSIVSILIRSNRLSDYNINPQEFISIACEAINRTKRLALVDGIKYQRIGESHYFAQELFKLEELTGYLKNSLETQKSVYERVIYDSAGVERKFAESLEANVAVKVYAKLPNWFKVPTPLGSYNPDWAVVVEDCGQEKLFFVVETKSSGWWDDLRHREGAKIACGEAHFAILADQKNPAKYIKATNLEDLFKEVSK